MLAFVSFVPKWALLGFFFLLSKGISVLVFVQLEANLDGSINVSGKRALDSEVEGMDSSPIQWVTLHEQFQNLGPSDKKFTSSVTSHMVSEGKLNKIMCAKHFTYSNNRISNNNSRIRFFLSRAQNSAVLSRVLSQMLSFLFYFF